MADKSSYSPDKMREQAASLTKLAQQFEALAAATEASANHPTGTAKHILSLAGFRVIHADAAHDLLSLVRWARGQESDAYDAPVLDQLERALIDS